MVTTTITAIPDAGHRGVDTRDDFVDKQEAFQDALVATTVDEMNDVGTEMNTTATAVNDDQVTVVAKEALMNPHYDAIDAVYANETNVNIVATNDANVTIVADDIANVNTTAGSIANVNTVAGDLVGDNNITIVADDIANVNTTAGSIANVNTVAGDLVGDNNITIVANDIANVNSVATTVVPNIDEILLADDNATIATTQAGIATTQAELADTARIASEAALDSFDDKYLGAKASDPTLDNDGDALEMGATYWNTTDDQMKVYDTDLVAWSAITFVPTAHGSLSGRGDADTHPISAITDLTTTLADKAEKSNVLERDNTDVYSPSSQYEPATKAYVDSVALTGGGNVEITQVYREVASQGQSTFFESRAYQEDTVDTITVANSTTYTLTINGTEATYDSDSDATSAEITLGLVNAINALSEPVTATDGVDEFTILSDTIGLAFTTVITAGTMTNTTTTANDEGEVIYIVGSINITLNGVELDSTDYTAGDGYSIVITGITVDADDIVRLTSYGGADVYNKTQSDALYSTVSDTSLKLDADNPSITGGFTEEIAVMPADAIVTTDVGTYITRTLTANTTLTNSLTDGQSGLYHFIDAGVTYTLTYPSMKWVGGVVPTLTDDDFISFWMEGSQLWGKHEGTGIQV